ncbi:glycosyltransferase [Aquimarina sp. BL5]|uniref:glycosyltransferase n=1 Tax=Aquimarina sp. BL5 TaxID=1714860 RepID=UPI000E4D4870|nr:glycosyltransferase [Aquimarina sp. BL5]AXT50488.1 glycosyltransferase [Aquimarina sp. BL5]RKM89781.1 glycosyltransferase [Aquimarina sp. BL5]
MKFSIITITHNRAHLITDTISSVLKQSYEDYEHIIIDDGSTDNTHLIIENFKDDRLKYHKYKKSKHRSFLRNEGIRKSSGDIICILDSDDIWKENKLSHLFSLFNQEPNINFIFHNASILREDKTHISNIYSFKKDFFQSILKKILCNKVLPYPFYSFKRSILKEIDPYDKSMIDGQHDFFLRAAAKYPFYYCSEILSYKIDHTTNLSKNLRVSALTNYIITLKKLFESNAITENQYKKYKNEIYFKIVYFFIKKGDRQKAKEFLDKTSELTSWYNKRYLKIQILRLNQKFITNG